MTPSARFQPQTSDCLASPPRVNKSSAVSTRRAQYTPEDIDVEQAAADLESKLVEIDVNCVGEFNFEDFIIFASSLIALKRAPNTKPSVRDGASAPSWTASRRPPRTKPTKTSQTYRTFQTSQYSLSVCLFIHVHDTPHPTLRVGPPYISTWTSVPQPGFEAGVAVATRC
jgi:hypothetical protein